MDWNIIWIFRYGLWFVMEDINFIPLIFSFPNLKIKYLRYGFILFPLIIFLQQEKL